MTMVVIDTMLNTVDLTLGKQPKWVYKIPKDKINVVVHRQGLLSEAESEDLRHVPIQSAPTLLDYKTDP